MPEDIKLTAEEQQLERMLGSIPAVPTTINRDALMFAAGAASVAKPVIWPWRIACGIAVLASVAVLLVRPTRTIVERTAAISGTVPAESVVAANPSDASYPMNFDLPAHAATDTDAWSYLRLQKDILAHGVDALPHPSTSPTTDNPIPPLNADTLDAVPLWERHVLSSQGDRS